MTGNGHFTKTPWIDPDDAPEWTAETFAQADRYNGATLVRRGRPSAVAPKVPVSLRLSPDVVARFKATGAGWQTRMDAAPSDWLARNGL